MRFLFVNKASIRIHGGAETRMREIGKRLVQMGHEVYVVCGKTQPLLPSYEKLDGIKVQYVKTIPRFLFKFPRLSFYLSRYMFYILSPIAIYLTIKRKNIDVIIDDVSPCPSFAYLIAKLLHKPCHATIHEIFGSKWFKLKDPATAVLGFFSQYLLKVYAFDKIITVSNSSKDALTSFGIPQKKVAVIPNGIGISRFNRRENVSKEKNSIVTVGRLVKQKGHIYLIQAMKKVAKETPKAKLYIVGDGPYKTTLESFITKLGLKNNVILIGNLPEEEKVQMLLKSEIFALTSLQEGFGIALLEAMACGLPLVVSDLPVFRELLRDGQNGFLVETANPKETAEKITHLLHSKSKIEEMSKINRKHVEKFDWNVSTQRLEDIIRKNFCISK